MTLVDPARLDLHGKAQAWKNQNKRVLGIFDIYVPEEIIHAAGMLPVRILGSLEYPTLADRQTTDKNCPLLRTMLDQGLRGAYDYLDGYAAADTCDQRSRFFIMWQGNIKKPFTYAIPLPHKRGQSGEIFFLRELVKFKASLEDSFGVKITDESLRHSIKVYNETRGLLRKLYELRKGDPPLISGNEALKVVIGSAVSPKEEYNRYLRGLIDEIPRRGSRLPKGPRLLVTGGPIYELEFLRQIEEAGGSIVADDMTTGSRYFWNDVDTTMDPMTALASRYARIPGTYIQNTNDIRFERVMDMIKEYNVQGVVVHNLKACTPDWGAYPYLRAKFEEHGIPHTVVEQQETLGGVRLLGKQLESFVELLQ